jgi:hypothetical protein
MATDEVTRNSQLQALETHWAGHRFRSRGEARWAVFFQEAGIPWEYEPQGYKLEHGCYLPDFWLPTQECFIEIKSGWPTEEECEIAYELAHASGFNVYLFYGHIPYEGGESPFYPQVFGDSAYALFGDCPGFDVGHMWCECPVCAEVGIEFQAEASRLPCHCSNCDPNGASPRLLRAYAAARSARFEHGEGPGANRKSPARKPTLVDAACGLLLTRLSRHPQALEVLLLQGREKGYSESTMWRAARKLKLVCVRRKGPSGTVTLWSLPAEEGR